MDKNPVSLKTQVSNDGNSFTVKNIGLRHNINIKL